jgi:hypothetical protein
LDFSAESEAESAVDATGADGEIGSAGSEVEHAENNKTIGTNK